MKKQFKLLLLFVLIPILGFPNDPDYIHTKQKTIKKAYFVNSDAGLYIDNSYGNISVTTWDEDKTELDIVIKVSGDNENWVNQRIDDIDVDIIALKGMITAKTILGNSSYKSNGKNNSFQINYTLKIPKNGSVKLHNKYGNINTSDLFSDAEIKCKYGKIALGRLSGNMSNILVEYCSNSSISFLKNATITAKYSNLKIGEATKLNLASDYTDVDIQESDVVKYISKYGNIKIQNVKSLDATGNYLTLKVGELSNNLKLSTKYSNVNIGTINAKANTITIAAAYTGLNIGFDANYAFDFNVSVKYANFKYDNELEINSKEDLHNLKKYSGFYKKKGVNNVSIISDYGNVVLVKKQ
ncbi:hypothetical protein [Flavobacterium sp. GT3P67]|uniref:hypothetical protein n=1 Tax=Flavobacterium sp. GT3P67 TaxID=2541722 RepID=UPI00104BB036|nr:hypothetical protein [Flavobacterium sp. GT3P67]TDE49884.1 hypothetical protein E0H99_15250 [Flavobacterium sp. GT3P67]